MTLIQGIHSNVTIYQERQENGLWRNVILLWFFQDMWSHTYTSMVINIPDTHLIIIDILSRSCLWCFSKIYQHRMKFVARCHKVTEFEIYYIPSLNLTYPLFKAILSRWFSFSKGGICIPPECTLYKMRMFWHYRMPCRVPFYRAGIS